MIAQLRSAIVSIGSGITGLTGGFWYLEASESTKLPYAVLSFVTNTTDRDTANIFEEVYFQINLYDKSGSNIEIIKESILDAFDDSESKFTLVNYKLDRIDRQVIRAMKADRVFQISIQYKISLTKK